MFSQEIIELQDVTTTVTGAEQNLEESSLPDFTEILPIPEEMLPQLETNLPEIELEKEQIFYEAIASNKIVPLRMLQCENEEYGKVFLEINGYKKQKEEKLRNLANKMANNVIKFRKPIKLEPMSAYERMIIHTELANRTDVKTESYGEEPRRRVVIRKKY